MRGAPDPACKTPAPAQGPTLLPRWERLATAGDTALLGAAVAARLRAGDAVCLHGPLGAGKTTLARGLLRALTRPDLEAPSPTFTLVQAYETPAFPVAHFDLYRLRRPEEADELGLDEALDEGAALIEWPERLGGVLPADRLDVTLRIEGGSRRATLEGHGTWAERVAAGDGGLA